MRESCRAQCVPSESQTTRPFDDLIYFQLEYLMNRLSHLSRPDVRLGAFTLLSAALLSVFAAPAFAARECAAFAVTIRDRTFTPGPNGDFRITLPAQFVQGQVAQVRGTYISFNVNLNTFR